MASDEMNRRDFAGLVMSSGLALSNQRTASYNQRRPNFLFVCSDEHIGTYMGCQGHPLVRTPNMDRLAARGTLFRNAYSNAPVCAPGRASLMTGRRLGRRLLLEQHLLRRRQFYRQLEKRLGPGQARSMTYRHYKGGMPAY